MMRTATHNVIVRMSPSLLIWEASGREKVEREGRCRMCLINWEVRIPTRHHIVPQSWFKSRIFVLIARTRRVIPCFRIRDCNANIIPLCVQCHMAVEKSNDDSARRMLRKVMGSNESAFAVQLMGQTWFDLRYPPMTAPATRAHKSAPHLVVVNGEMVQDGWREVI